MPPRKKTDQPPAPTRSSARVKAAASVASAATPEPAPAPATDAKAPEKPKSKPKSGAKRSRDDSDDEEEEDALPQVKPASKKARTTKATGKAKDQGKLASDANADAEPEEEAKTVKVVKRGAAPVDPASGKVHTHQVYTNAGAVWDAMLNQTDIGGGANKNKFYVLQLLHPLHDSSHSVLFTRWGRVGETGQSQEKGPFPASMAVNEFKKQFRAKASVAWEQRVGMTPKKGKYFWLERSYDDDEEMAEGTGGTGGGKAEKHPVPESTLTPEVQDFCKLIFNAAHINATLFEMQYDARKLPLGKLSKQTISAGYQALKDLEEVIVNPNSVEAQKHGSLNSACENLTSGYYSIIPHNFGRERPRVISSREALKIELEIVATLGEMEIATKLLQQSSQVENINPLDAQFRSLELSSMEPVPKASREFQTLQKYAHDTHAVTHQNIKPEVLHVYRVVRRGEADAFKSKGFDTLDGERLLLWHGSRTTNFAGILKQGLRIAPPEAPVNGYMFGKGVYFADMMSKSANYCYAHLSNRTGILLLCEVAAKPFHERTNAEFNADQGCKAAKKLSTKGLGQTQPTKWKDAGKALENEELTGCLMPDGGGERVNSGTGSLYYNEYIVYDVSQIKVKYLMMMQM